MGTLPQPPLHLDIKDITDITDICNHQHLPDPLQLPSLKNWLPDPSKFSGSKKANHDSGQVKFHPEEYRPDILLAQAETTTNYVCCKIYPATFEPMSFIRPVPLIGPN